LEAIQLTNGGNPGVKTFAKLCILAGARGFWPEICMYNVDHLFGEGKKEEKSVQKLAINQLARLIGAAKRAAAITKRKAL